MMKRTLLSLGLAALFAVSGAGFAAADCYADYKAKRDNPLKLHYGVIALDDAACGSTSDAAPVVAERIGVDGWQLLNVVSIFGAEDLKKRKESAGAYFLRY